MKDTSKNLNYWGKKYELGGSSGNGLFWTVCKVREWKRIYNEVPKGTRGAQIPIGGQRKNKPGIPRGNQWGEKDYGCNE